MSYIVLIANPAHYLQQYGFILVRVQYSIDKPNDHVLRCAADLYT